jgi:hypothetical protein
MDVEERVVSRWILKIKYVVRIHAELNWLRMGSQTDSCEHVV